MNALPERFWAKVDKSGPNGCWIWTAALSRGYGKFGINGGTKSAHRLSYESLVGPIPEGLQLDHLCRTPACVNPDHLEAVTGRVNILRSTSPAALHAVKTHCPQGHPYDEQNTSHYRGLRYCDTCRKAHSMRSKERHAAAVQADPNDSRHGTLTAYASYGCRCDRCRAAWRTYMKQHRAKAMSP